MAESTAQKEREEGREERDYLVRHEFLGLISRKEKNKDIQ